MGSGGCGTAFELSPNGGGSWTETVLYNFQGDKDGQLPYGDLVFDKQGNLYGATLYGGGFGSCNMCRGYQFAVLTYLIGNG